MHQLLVFYFKEPKMIAYNTRLNYDTSHGSAFDRGSADSHYGRPARPHMYMGATYTSDEIGASEMTPAEIQAYYAGYQWNEQFGDKKDYS
jgi:hypothetical protein